jgi:hypothetical protein
LGRSLLAMGIPVDRPTESSIHAYPLLAGIEMVFWGLTEALQTVFYRVF